MNRVDAGTLVLEPQLTAHAAEMFGVLSDPAIYEFENSPPVSAAWLAARCQARIARLPRQHEQWLNWVIRLPSGVLAGYVQVTIASDGTAHIAYELGSQFWRQRIGSTAVRAMLAELSSAHGVRTFAATLKERNYRSLALLRSLGFERVGSSGSDEIVMRKRTAEALFGGT